MTDSLADIEAAERLMGVVYTAAERAQMAGNLAPMRDWAEARRRLEFANAEPVASRFDPRLPSFVMPEGPDALDWTPATAPLPEADEDVAFASLPQLSQWLRTGAISSRALTEIYLARIATYGPRLECFAAVTADLARAEADAMDAERADGHWRGPLHGVPYGLKDLFDTAGVVTGWGAEPCRERVPGADARVVTLLRDAGAVLIGKTAVGALAYNDIWYGGRCRNPWNLNEGSSGSSAGSASAVAAGLCGFAIGTETYGSITSPSQRCGTTGLRPTFGRVSRAGGMTLCWSLDKVGPICRGVEDTAIVLAAINGPDAADRGSIAAPFRYRPGGVGGMVVGYLPEAFGEGATEVDRAALAAVRGLGVTVRALSLPELPYDALQTILLAEAAAAFEHLTLSGLDDTLTWQDEEAWPNTFRKARFLSAVDHVQADRLRYRVMQAVGEMMEGIDVLVGPFATGPMLLASNFTGHPCLHLRAGFDRVATRGTGGLSGEGAPEGALFEVPQGISLWAGLFDEEPMLRLGVALEAALGVVGRRPSFAV